MDSLNILIVDDDRDIGKFITAALKREAPGYSIAMAVDGRECLEYVDGGNPVDCILSDYEMPLMSGMELLAELRSRGNNVPFIFITGQGNEEVAREAFKKGADDYFTKDIGIAHFTRILNSVEQAVRRRALEKEHIRAEEQVHMLKHSIDVNLDGAYWMDAEGRFVYVNDAGCASLGYSREELLGMTIYDINPLASPERMEDVWKKLRVEGHYSGNSVHRRKDGSEFPVEISTTYLLHGGGEYACGFARDITGRKQAEDALKDNEERFRTLFETANDAIFLMEGDTFIECNSKTVEMFGCAEKSDIVGRKPYEYSPEFQPDGMPSFDKAMGYINAALSGEPQRFPWTHSRKDGSLFDVEVSLNCLVLGGRTYLHAIVRDITRQKAAENALVEERNKLDAVLENIGDGIGIFDPDFRVLYQNKAHKAMAGDHVGEYCYSAFENREAVCEGCPVAKSLADGRVHKAYRSNVINGKDIHVDITSSVLKDASGDVAAGIELVRDVTERYQTEQALLREMEFSDSVIKSMPGVFYVYDEEMHIVRWNSAYMALFGETPGGPEAIHALDTVVEEDRDMVASKMRRVFVEHVDESAELTLLASDGGRYPYYCTGTPMVVGDRTYLVGMGVDISELRRAQESSARLAEAVKSSDEGIFVMDAGEVIRYANPAFEKMTGFALAELAEMTPDMLICGSDGPGTSVGESGQGRAWCGGCVLCRKDGVRRDIDMTISPVNGPSGEVTSYVAVVRDITERKRLMSIAESVSSMNNLGYVFASVRHEIGGPINAVRMTLNILKEGMDEYSKSELSDSIGKCIEEIDRVKYIMHSLKSFNMYESLNPAVMSLSSFMDKFLPLVRGDFGRRGIRVEYSDVTGGCSVRIDPRALQQVMLNLVSNASDALEGVEEAAIRITVSNAQSMVNIAVHDNGSGMTPEQSSNLFKPFYTSKRNGTGLGLVIAKRMLSMMDGTIDIASEAGFGTTAVITIPEAGDD